MSLRLGVACAVIDDAGKILLSQRDDLNVWNLPGGRLDSGEALIAAAAREVREETGIIAQVERPVNLYYWAGFQRVNVLFAGWPLGGKLQSRTDETRDNQYFAPTSLPKMLNRQQVAAALSPNHPQPAIISMSPAELRRMRRTLNFRWVQNLLRGKPEPRFPHFDVRAVAVIRDERFQRVLTIEGQHGRILPRIRCTGLDAPWNELTNRMKHHCGVTPHLRWVGIWQDVNRDVIEFIFAATIREKALKPGVEWSSILNTPLSDRDLDYVEHVQPSYAQAAVWMVAYEDITDDNDIILSGNPGV